MNTKTPTDLSNIIWNIADTLRGAFKQSDYSRIILPFAVLRRLECVQAPHAAVIADIIAKMKDAPESLIDASVQSATKLPFYNRTGFTLASLGADNTADNLFDYVSGYSHNVNQIFTHFKFSNWINSLQEAKLLLTVIQKFQEIDLSPSVVSNHDMGLIFEHLIRKFAESSNETAGEHFTPRDIVRLTTQLVIQPDHKALTEPGIIRSVYDCAAGTGGFLSMAEELAKELNPNITLGLYGQEINPESYAIGMADMLLLGQDAGRYKLGDTLNNDQFPDRKFHYGLTNPPFGVNWQKVKDDVEQEHKRGAAGRFAAGLPSVRDGSMLFLQNMWSKREAPQDGGSRLGIILSGSPLFNGGAGSGESQIRRWILENDWLEAIVALPTDLFYNTGIGTYIWILSNKKDARRKGLVQLIDATALHSPMRKSLGSKRRFISDADIQRIIDVHSAFIEQESIIGDDHITPKSKIFATTDFGYRRISIQRPLRLRFNVSSDALEAYAESKGSSQIEALAELEGREFETLKELLKAAGIDKLTATARKLIFQHFGVRSDDAPIVMKNKKEPEVDTSLNETENVPLGEDIEAYFQREVLPHVPDAWIDTSKVDPQDGQVGVVGYEINFNRYFYEYQAPRPLEEIDAELRAVEAEIAALLAEVVR